MNIDLIIALYRLKLYFQESQSMISSKATPCVAQPAPEPVKITDKNSFVFFLHLIHHRWTLQNDERTCPQVDYPTHLTVPWKISKKHSWEICHLRPSLSHHSVRDLSPIIGILISLTFCLFCSFFCLFYISGSFNFFLFKISPLEDRALLQPHLLHHLHLCYNKKNSNKKLTNKNDRTQPMKKSTSTSAFNLQSSCKSKQQKEKQQNTTN